MSQQSRHAVLLTVLGLSTLLSVAGAFILTDAGQVFDISKEIVIGYFRIHLFTMWSAFGLLIAGLVFNRRWKLLHRWQEVLLVVVVVGQLDLEEPGAALFRVRARSKLDDAVCVFGDLVFTKLGTGDGG